MRKLQPWLKTTFLSFRKHSSQVIPVGCVTKGTVAHEYCMPAVTVEVVSRGIGCWCSCCVATGLWDVSPGICVSVVVTALFAFSV